MALNASLLAQQLIAASGVQASDAAGRAAWTLVADVIVAHIRANATVTVSVTGTAAVTTAPGAAPVTGTGVGTVS